MKNKQIINPLPQGTMLHLDLKPKNVMLNSEDNTILIDFGLSKQYDSSSKPESSTTALWGENTETINLSSSVYNEFDRHFKDARLTYTLKGTGEKLTPHTCGCSYIHRIIISSTGRSNI